MGAPAEVKTDDHINADGQNEGNADNTTSAAIVDDAAAENPSNTTSEGGTDPNQNAAPDATDPDAEEE